MIARVINIFLTLAISLLIKSIFIFILVLFSNIIYPFVMLFTNFPNLNPYI